MPRTVLAAAMAASLALTAPAAHADDPQTRCGWRTVQTGPERYEGVMYAFAVHPGGGGVSVRCYVKVNGVEVDGTEHVVPGDRVSVAVGRLSYERTYLQSEVYCTEVTTSHGTRTECYYVDSVPIPPQEVKDLANDLGWCDAAAAAGALAGGGVPGVAEVGADGDVSLLWHTVWDCP